VIAAALLGGAAGADRTAVGQTMLAHPAIAAVLSAWVVGAPREGMWLGLALGLIALAWLPMGEERPRDTTSVAVAVPVAVGASAPPWQWGLALLVALLLARPLGLAIDGVRALALRYLRRARAACERGETPSLERGHFGLAALHFLRGAAATVLAAVVIGAVVTVAERGVDEAARYSLGAVWWAAPLVGIPRLLRRRRWWWAAGAAVGAAGVWLGGARW